LLYKRIKTIYLVHSYHLKDYFNSRLLSRLLYRKKQIVAVSKEITKKIKEKYNLNNTVTIYNSFETVSKNEVTKSNIPKHNFILFYGRIENKSKNLYFLIDSYKRSCLYKKNIKLIILGDGPDLNNLKKYSTNINHIIFESFKNSPFDYVEKALFTVMTSHYEGFPMTIIESLSLGTPVVSLNFKSGPSEVIETGKNGILVNSTKIIDFTKALNRMIEDKKFYLNCKLGSKESVKKFKKQYISQQWINLIESL